MASLYIIVAVVHTCVLLRKQNWNYLFNIYIIFCSSLFYTHHSYKSHTVIANKGNPKYSKTFEQRTQWGRGHLSLNCREVVLFLEICCKPIRNFLKTKQHLKFVKHIMIYSTSFWCFSFSIAKWQEQLLLVVHEWIWIGVKTVFYLTTLPNLICNIPAYSFLKPWN